MGYLLFDDMIEDARLIINGAKAINNLAKSERVKQGVKQMQNLGGRLSGNKMRWRSICPNCGSKAREGSSFCSKCGTSLVVSEDQESVVQERG